MKRNISFSSTTNNSITSTLFLNPLEEKRLEYEFASNTGYKEVFLMAKAFLCISEMTHKKLQKLCYYAKAWYLALYDQNIVSDNFEAWVHGAVQPDLYFYYKRYGFSVIPRVMDKELIPEEFLSFAQEIYNSYGHLNGDELEMLNHTEEPWLNARTGYKPWENCNVIISENDMKEYYRKMI